MKNKNFGVEFEKAWLDVYYTLEDNAFDHSRIMLLDDGMAIANGVKYWEVPF
jgi:hypothetical protein